MAKWNLEAVRDEVEDDVVNQPPHYGNGKIECIEGLALCAAPFISFPFGM